MSQKTVAHRKEAKTGEGQAASHREQTAEAVAQAQAAMVPVEAASLDKVREILFGNQARTHEQQFNELERQLNQLTTDVNTRFEHLEDMVEKGFNTLTQQVQAERDARQQAQNRAGDSSREMEASLTQKLTKLEKKVDTETQSLLQEILDQSSQLTESMHEKSEALMGELEKEVKKRRTQSQGERAHLSALFGELSARLQDES